MSEEFVYYTHDLCMAVGADKATICSKVWFFCKDQDKCNISLTYLSTLLCKDVQTTRRLVKELHDAGYIEYIPQFGRGVLPVFKKGIKMIPFFDGKGIKNAQKKVSNLPPKNINKNINNLVCLDNTHPRISNKQNKQTKKEVMDTFNEFWQVFFFGSYAKYEEEQSAYKERAQAVWSLMSENARRSCIQQLRNGKRYDKTTYVVHYLQRFKEPLRIWFSGDAELTPQLRAELVAVRFNGKIGYCYPADLDRVLKEGAVKL